MIILKEIKIRYDHLDSILKDKLQDIRFSNSVNIIVDLKEVFRKLFRPNVLEESEVTPARVEELSSDIINIVSHYRNYFFKNGKYSSFYFFYSKSECDLMKVKYPDYKKEYYDSVLRSTEEPKKVSLVRKTVEILDKILNNVPNCMFIDTSKYDEFVMSKFLVQKTNSNEINIILSNDEIMAQLIDSHTFMLNIKSNSTHLLDTANALQVFTKTKTELSANLAGLYSAITGTRRYDLPNIPKFAEKKTLLAIEKLVKKDKILDKSYVEFPLTLNLLDANDNIEKVILSNFEQIKNNYNIITGNDVLYTHTSDITTMFNKTKAVYNWNYFLDLNAKVFTRYPLSLDMLLKGETIK
jgi:hypothetical protein